MALSPEVPPEYVCGCVLKNKEAEAEEEERWAQTRKAAWAAFQRIYAGRGLSRLEVAEMFRQALGEMED